MCLFYFIDCCNNIYQNFSLEKLLKKNKPKQNKTLVFITKAMDGITDYCSLLSSDSKAFYLMTIFVSATQNFMLLEIKTGFTSTSHDGFYFQKEISSINFHRNVLTS